MELDALIRGETIGLLHIPADYFSAPQGLTGLWRRHLVANAAVRDRDYMAALFKSHFPQGTLIDVERGWVPGAAVLAADNIVLLFPDSIGMDFGAIENQLMSRRSSGRVLVLNGRRRFFKLDSRTRRSLRLRRFLEATRLPEVAIFTAFLVTTPVLLLVDAIRGQR